MAALYPRRCPLCERILLPEDGLVCPRCAKKLPYVREPFCRRCGKPIDSPTALYCADCELHEHSYDQGRAVFIYEGDLRKSIDRFKFYNHREYVPFYGRAMALLFHEYQPFWQVSCIISVPMHPKKRRERGFDQSLLLARALSAETGVPVLENFLIRTRYSRSSKKLGRSSRRTNLRGIFSVDFSALTEKGWAVGGQEYSVGGRRSEAAQRRFEGRIPSCVLIVDDIYTTGATMDEASATLRRAGVRKIFFLTLSIGRGQT